jgi:hypothetical protein
VSLRPTFSPEDLLLIRAAFAAETEAEAAWSTWLTTAHLHDLTGAAQLVIPEVLARRSRGDDPRVAAAVTAVAHYSRFSWLRTQLLLARAADLAARLVDAGHRPVALNATAVLHHAGLSPERRPMTDVDLLIDGRGIDEVAEVITAAGWSLPAQLADSASRAVAVDRHHALPVHDGHGAIVDLHWRALARSSDADGDDGFRARTLPVADRPWRVAGVEDSIVHLIARGIRWGTPPGPRWLFDIAALLERGPPDWDVVLEVAGQYGLGPIVAAGLDSVDRWVVPVPDEVRVAADRLGGRSARLELAVSARVGTAGATVRAAARRLASLVSST